MVNVNGKRVVVMGLGRFGGGVGVTRFLVGRGARVLVTDLEPADKLTESMAKLSDLPAGSVEYKLGGHDAGDFTSADLVVVNPAVNPRRNEFVLAARKAKVPLTSEIRLLISHLPEPHRQVIAVTGSAGKSTTTAMIGHILEKVIRHEGAQGQKAWIGGNIGGSLLSQHDQIKPDDYVVLELSSFMLEGLREDRWSPHVAVVTNCTPNHLDWHGSMAEYVAAKRTILDFQQAEDIAVLGAGVADWPTRPGIERFIIRDEPYAIPLLVPGQHNKVNAMMAVCAIGEITGAPAGELIEALADFAGLPNRLQFVCEHAGVRYFNDSKATTPEAAMLALSAFEPGIVHVILGGYDKGSDLSPVARLARQRCRAIYTIGKTGDAIADAALASSGDAQVIRSGTLDHALADITTRLNQGDVVLLSPACASWDQFENYEKRGAAFVEAVLKHTGEGAPLPKAC